MGDEEGISGAAKLLEGAAHGITAANQLGDFGAGDFTVSAWVKMTSPPAESSACVFSHYASYAGRFASVTLQLSGNGSRDFMRETALETILAHSLVHCRDEWHQLTGVREGQELRLYVDGELASTVSAPGLGNRTDQAARPISYVRLGASYMGPNHWYQLYPSEGVLNGLLDEVMVHSRALTAAEIQQNQIAVSQELPEWNHVIAHWKFEETTGTDVSEVTSRSPGFHNGVILEESGKCGDAYRFDGVDDAVILNNGIGNFGEGDFTVTLWVKPEQHALGGQGKGIFHRYGGGVGRFSDIYIGYHHGQNIRPELYF